MAFDAFLKIEGVDGESTDDKHKNEIDVLSFSWGASQPGAAVGGAITRDAKVTVKDLSIVKHVDKATPQLLISTCSGGTFPSATLTVRQADSAMEFLKVTMTDVLISGISGAGSSQTDPLPVEQVSFNFAKIEFAYISAAGEPTVGSCSSAFYKVN